MKGCCNITQKKKKNKTTKMKNHNMFISVGQATEGLKWGMFGVKMRRYTQRNRAQMNEQQTGGRKNIQRSISGEGKIKKKTK